jgi:hypothetical protein
MTAKLTHMNTADRLCTGDTIEYLGKRVLIVDITLTDRGALALLTVNPHGATFGHADAKLLLFGSGACVHFTPGRHDFGIAGHRPSDKLKPTQVRRCGPHYEVFDNTDYTWVHIVAAPYSTECGPVEASNGPLYSLAERQTVAA